MFFAIIQHDTSIVELHYDVTFGCIDAVLRTTVSFTTFLLFFFEKEIDYDAKKATWAQIALSSTPKSMRYDGVDRPQVATP